MSSEAPERIWIDGPHVERERARKAGRYYFDAGTESDGAIEYVRADAADHRHSPAVQDWDATETQILLSALGGRLTANDDRFVNAVKKAVDNICCRRAAGGPEDKSQG